jgi:hypothetical protein
MKKIYQKPTMKLEYAETENLLEGSGVFSIGIDYGGVDDGTNTPSSRQNNSLWDDDDDDWL